MKFAWKAVIVASALSLIASSVSARDWPTHRGNYARSGVAEATIQAPLELKWAYESHTPRPAWPGPARRDGWHKVENLKPRQVFDWAYHVIGADGKVYFGSSADDKVYCLDAESGEELWSFFTDGPIRLAPTYADGKLYVGSDDGVAYCLDASTGDLLWTVKPSPDNYRVAGNGRLISLWPIRTSIVVEHGVAYFFAGLFPLEGVYFCAADAESGEILWSNLYNNVPPQGYMLASSDRVYVPTGRGTPAVFNRQTGDFIQSLGGSGGTFALLTGDMLVYGPGKTGQLDAFSEGETSDHLATFDGNHMVVTPDRTYLHTDTEMSAIDRARHAELLREQADLRAQRRDLENRIRDLGRDVEGLEAQRLRVELEETVERLAEIPGELQECILWRRACSHPYSLVLAGDVLFAGGGNEVAAYHADSGAELWKQPVKGRALDLAIADNRLLVSTDEGVIYSFQSTSGK